jgi:chemotaxis protein methyltransferase CheR
MTDPGPSERARTAAARLLADRVGLRLDPAIRGRLSRCLTDAAAARSEDLATYVTSLTAQPAAFQDLLNRVTVQETAFFRDPKQFAALTAHVLPDLAPPVTIWSAGCSNGQEPYSLAMALDEAGCPSWRVVATDVSTRALERARRGRYAARELTGLSPERRERYLVPAGSAWEVTPALRSRVDFVHHNLVADPPPLEAGQCPVVFCRNVLIYFGSEEVVAFLERLARWLSPGGWLFLGYSESLWQVTDLFTLTHLGDAFVYRRPDPAAVLTETRPTASARASAPDDDPHRLAATARPSRGRDTTAAGRPAKGTRGRPRPARPAPARLDPAPGATVGAVRAAGEAAMAAGDYVGAITAFRKGAYLDPDQPIAHLHLGLALEGAGDPPAARRAYAAARAALERGGTGGVEVTLEGYQVAELVRLLDDKLAEPAPGLRSPEGRA